MSRPVRPPRASALRSLLIVSGALLGMLAIVLAAVALRVPGAPAATPVPHFVDVPAQQAAGGTAARTLYVGERGQRLPLSGTGGLLLANLEQGQLPAGATSAVVLSDANCQPDQNGVSHCLNELSIGEAHVLVRHYHKMSETPCLSPGEVVRLTDKLAG